VIISIGTDIIEVFRIKETIERTPRFVERVFTERERAYCDSKGVAAAQHYAARFSAKEAALKSLGTGWAGKIAWHDIEVRSNEKGAPYLEVTGGALEVMKSLGATAIHVSLSHTTVHATAQVILEKV
jgi:holo-[acyl-carrier protein] synthase